MRSHGENMALRADDIRDMPTLHSGQYANLKIETEDLRVWLCRVTDQVEIERLVDGCWVSDEQ